MSEAAVSYAAIILADAEVEITSEKLLTLTQAAGVTNVEPIWAQLYAKAISAQNIHELLTAVSTGGAAAGGAAPAASAGDAAFEDAAEEEKEEEKEESDEDMGMGLFD